MAKKTTVEEKKAANMSAKLIISPRVTEKASLQSEANAFTFVVASHATKMSLRDEIKRDYKVTPRAINITNIPRQYVFSRGKLGQKSGFKKAVVFLKKGDTIKLG